MLHRRLKAGVVNEKDFDRRIEDMEVLLTGNGKPERGMVVRLDRIERELSVLRRIGWALCGGVGAILPTVLLLLFK